MQSLKGKVALITGASSGIGAAIAEYFDKQGARLSFAGRKPDNLHEVASKTNLSKTDILTTVGDIVRVEDRRELVTQTMDKFGQLDILVGIDRKILKKLGVYCMSKVALDAFTKVLAAELGPRGVRVNSVNPGFIPTRVIQRSNVKNPRKMMSHLASSVSLGRSGTPEEIAQVAAFLASDLAPCVTGELLYADGGLRLRNSS